MEAIRKEKDETEVFEALPEGTCAELIDGIIFMSPAPNRKHQDISMGLSWAIRSHISESGSDCRVYAAPFDVYLDDLVNEGVHDCFQPDISVICDKDKLQDDGCHGAPDWIIEITSPSTQHRDYMTKLFKYRAAGVKEYWIVNPVTETVSVYRFSDEPQGEQYRFTDAVPVGICPGFEIRISDLVE